MSELELRKRAIASMDNCYLEVSDNFGQVWVNKTGTTPQGFIHKLALPPALREKIYDQIIDIQKSS